MMTQYRRENTRSATWFASRVPLSDGCVCVCVQGCPNRKYAFFVICTDLTCARWFYMIVPEFGQIPTPAACRSRRSFTACHIFCSLFLVATCFAGRRRHVYLVLGDVGSDAWPKLSSTKIRCFCGCGFD